MLQMREDMSMITKAKSELGKYIQLVKYAVQVKGVTQMREQSKEIRDVKFECL